jgi:carbonic anhydrase/acetyltransferase-like protein (isoleucine patch superfamily)
VRLRPEVTVLDGVPPAQIHDSAFVAPAAQIAGDVTVGPEASIWYQAVIRGDADRVLIGCRSNIQDGAIVHCRAGRPVIIGEGVSIGHGAILHGCSVEDNCLVGLGARLLDGAKIARNTFVAAGALVLPGVYPCNMLLLGTPAKAVRELTEMELQEIRTNARQYVELGRLYRRSQA